MFRHFCPNLVSRNSTATTVSMHLCIVNSSLKPRRALRRGYIYLPLSHLGPVLPSGHRQVARSQRSSHVVLSVHGLELAPHCPSVVVRRHPSVTPRSSAVGCLHRRSSPSTRRERRQPVKSCVSTCPGRSSMVFMSLTPPTDSVVLLSSRIL